VELSAAIRGLVVFRSSGAFLLHNPIFVETLWKRGQSMKKSKPVLTLSLVSCTAGIVSPASMIPDTSSSRRGV
jgi:hypothetical protein